MGNEFAQRGTEGVLVVGITFELLQEGALGRQGHRGVYVRKSSMLIGPGALLRIDCRRVC